MKVPLLDLKSQYASLRNQVVPAFEEVLDSQYFINGPAVKQFEEAIAEYCQTTSAVGVSSGTDALVLSLMALNIGAGDEVITTTFTFFATAGAIWRVGAKPVFVDIDPVTFNIDPVKIEAAVTDKTKAIIPVHLFGQCADMDAIMAIAAQHNLKVIEDAAQAIGCTYKDRKAGTMGDTGCFSFFPSKNLGGAGDGGMVTTNESDLAERLLDGRNHGSRPKYHHKWVGGNFRLDTLQAAYLLIKLPHLESWSEGRRKNAALYDNLLDDIEQVTTPTIAVGNVSIYNQYTIRVSQRDELRAALAEAEIGTEIYYPVCMHRQECFAELGYGAGDLPEAEKAASEVLALPIYPELTTDQISHVAHSIRQFYVK
jgi:dTDP-4-amino-4,6-dideoxygalactose transaminase